MSEPRKASITKRLREMLLRQEEKFRAYLDLLEEQHKSIEAGDTERLQVQLELEKLLIPEIHALRRVIEPLEDLFGEACPEGDESVGTVRDALAGMAAEMKERNARNRAALQARMAALKGEIAGLRVWPRSAPGTAAAPRLIDVTA